MKPVAILHHHGVGGVGCCGCGNQGICGFLEVGVCAGEGGGHEAEAAAVTN